MLLSGKRIVENALYGAVEESTTFGGKTDYCNGVTSLQRKPLQPRLPGQLLGKRDCYEVTLQLKTFNKKRNVDEIEKENKSIEVAKGLGKNREINSLPPFCHFKRSKKSSGLEFFLYKFATTINIKCSHDWQKTKPQTFVVDPKRSPDQGKPGNPQKIGFFEDGIPDAFIKKNFLDFKKKSSNIYGIMALFQVSKTSKSAEAPSSPQSPLPGPSGRAARPEDSALPSTPPSTAASGLTTPSGRRQLLDICP